MDLQKQLLIEVRRLNEALQSDFASQMDAFDKPKKAKKRTHCEAELAVLTAALIAYANKQLELQAAGQVVMAAQQNYQICQYV